MSNEVTTQAGSTIALSESELIEVLGSSLYPGAQSDRATRPMLLVRWFAPIRYRRSWAGPATCSLH